MMKQLLISFGGGLLLLCVWGAVVVATSQDFAHEGPHGFWMTPVEAWSRVLINAGWSRSFSWLTPFPRMLLGIAILLSPFVLVLSMVAHLASWLLRRMMAERKFR